MVNFLKLFFTEGEYNSFEGIKSIRYRVLFIIEPLFLLIVIVLSILIQAEYLKDEFYKSLLVFKLIQFFFLIIGLVFYYNHKINRSYNLFLLLLFTLIGFLNQSNQTLYVWLFLVVLSSSFFYSYTKTAFVFVLMLIGMINQDKNIFISFLQNPEHIYLRNPIEFYTVVASAFVGTLISIIVYYFEKSCEKLQHMQICLDRKNSELHEELRAKKYVENALQGNELKFKTIVEHGFDGITIVDREGNDKFVSNSTEKITGYSAEEYKEGVLSMENVHPDDLQRVVENFRNISENRMKRSTIYYRYKHKDGEWRNLEVSVTNLLDNPGVEGILFVYRDVTKHIKAEKRARYLENYDQLTDLPNQFKFSVKVSEEIERSSARNRSFAVMCLGINSFKNINSEYGNNFGDIVLKQIGSRLKSYFRGDDFVSRMMGDKFLILFSDMKSENDVIAIVQKTMKSFEKSFWIDNRDITISVSIGISIYPQDATRKEELIKNSEAALFLCKENRERKYTMFNRALNEDLIQRIQIEKEIYKAIEDKVFTIYYQPKINRQGLLAGAEALIRWNTSERGMVPPGIFIPISERNRSIISIGKIVIEKTFSHIKEWNYKGLNPVTISINVAPLQFSDPDFIETVVKFQKLYGINPEYVEFEITETGIMENEDITLEKMEELTALGYSISIDDFGAGYSSLNKLKDYPVQILKIDKSFIDSIPENKSSCNIVKTIIDLAHNLNCQVVAEGVEEKEQLDILHEYNCDMIQGYYYYKPMPQNQFIKLIK